MQDIRALSKYCKDVYRLAKVVEETRDAKTAKSVKEYFNLDKLDAFISDAKEFTNKHVKDKSQGIQMYYDSKPLLASLAQAITFEENGFKMKIDSELFECEPKPRCIFFNNTTKEFSIYNILTQETSITKLPELEHDISDFCYIDINNQIYLVGGEIRSPTDGYLSYSNKTFVIRKNELVEKCSMNYGRCGHRINYLSIPSDTHCHFLVATGSKYPEEGASSCEVYNIIEDRWENGPEMAINRFYHTSVVVTDSVLYVIGGRSASNEKKVLKDIERLDFTKESLAWETLNFTNPDTNWSPRDTLGSYSPSSKTIIIFGGDQGWQSETFIINISQKEISLSDQYLKKSEHFLFTHPVKYRNKVYFVGG